MKSGTHLKFMIPNMKFYSIYCRNMARHARQTKEEGVTQNKTGNQYKTRKRKNDEFEDQRCNVNDLDGSFNYKRLDLIDYVNKTYLNKISI